MINAWHRSNETSKRLDEIPGVGPALATALVASVADPRAFRSGRDFSAWIGLVPKQHSSGGKDKLGGISKQGDRYLRSLWSPFHLPSAKSSTGCTISRRMVGKRSRSFRPPPKTKIGKLNNGRGHSARIAAPQSCKANEVYSRKDAAGPQPRRAGKELRRDCRDYRCDSRLVASYLLEIGDQPAAPHF